LKADRFKQKAAAGTSKVDEFLIKKYAKSMEIRQAKGLTSVQAPIKPTNKKFNELDELNDMQDLWATPKQVISKKHERYVNGFAKKDTINVRQV